MSNKEKGDRVSASKKLISWLGRESVEGQKNTKSNVSVVESQTWISGDLDVNGHDQHTGWVYVQLLLKSPSQTGQKMPGITPFYQ